MIMFSWNNKKHDEFANGLAEEFIKKYPLTINFELRDKKADKKLGKAINTIYNKAREYSTKVKLGVYSKARIGNKFMWALKEEGYEEVLIEELTKDLLISLSNKKHLD